MIRFIELHNLENDPYILNISIIGSVYVDKDGNTVIDPIGESGICRYKVRESYDAVKQKLIMVLA